MMITGIELTDDEMGELIRWALTVGNSPEPACAAPILARMRAAQELRLAEAFGLETDPRKVN
jgi:hypothetical protein